jgi:hypothetical protein
MKKIEPEESDELRPEYDLRSLRIRKLGSGRRSFGGTVRTEAEVTEPSRDAHGVVANMSDDHPTDSIDL